MSEEDLEAVRAMYERWERAEALEAAGLPPA
jgi:hypothetical protein